MGREGRREAESNEKWEDVTGFSQLVDHWLLSGKWGNG